MIKKFENFNDEDFDFEESQAGEVLKYGNFFAEPLDKRFKNTSDYKSKDIYIIYDKRKKRGEYPNTFYPRFGNVSADFKFSNNFTSSSLDTDELFEISELLKILKNRD